MTSCCAAPWHTEADDILRSMARGHVKCAATTHSMATTFYVGRKVVGTANARSDVRRFLNVFEILPIDRQTLVDADAQTGSDLEDNIMIAAAVSARVDAIITRNPADFAHSPIPVWEPAELLKQLAGAVPTVGGSSPSPP